MAAVAKQKMLDSLPIREGEFSIRKWEPADVDDLAQWPGYPFPYEAFNLRCRGADTHGRERYFHVREGDPTRITLVVDHKGKPTIGYIALVEIDWASGVVGNMGLRIAPSWCNRGVGTACLRRVCDWCFTCGFTSLRLDVAACNDRAIRCYEKAGFVRTGEFWRDEEGIKHVTLDQPKYDFLRPHVRFTQGMPSVRFYWMERRTKAERNTANVGGMRKLLENHPHQRIRLTCWETGNRKC